MEAFKQTLKDFFSQDKNRKLIVAAGALAVALIGYQVYKYSGKNKQTNGGSKRQDKSANGLINMLKQELKALGKVKPDS